jgi:methionine-R-sulfoxide reductase
MSMTQRVARQVFSIILSVGIVAAALLSIGCGPASERPLHAATGDGASSDDGTDQGKETDKKKAATKPKTTAKRKPMYNKLNAAEARVILRKGTERAFTGEYTDLKAEGTFICRQCNAPLYKSSDKFDSRCGWPSFDDELPDSVEQHPDPDGFRTEIVCKNCQGHLGHVFFGEGFTAKNTRHCVNSISMRFVPKDKELPKVIRAEEPEEAASESTEPTAGDN